MVAETFSMTVITIPPGTELTLQVKLLESVVADPGKKLCEQFYLLMKPQTFILLKERCLLYLSRTYNAEILFLLFFSYF